MFLLNIRAPLDTFRVSWNLDETAERLNSGPPSMPPYVGVRNNLENGDVWVERWLDGETPDFAWMRD